MKRSTFVPRFDFSSSHSNCLFELHRGRCYIFIPDEIVECKGSILTFTRNWNRTLRHFRVTGHDRPPKLVQQGKRSPSGFKDRSARPHPRISSREQTAKYNPERRNLSSRTAARRRVDFNPQWQGSFRLAGWKLENLEVGKLGDWKTRISERSKIGGLERPKVRMWEHSKIGKSELKTRKSEASESTVYRPESKKPKN